MNGIPDIEIEIFSGCKQAVLAVEPEAICRGAFVTQMESMPFVHIVEDWNTAYEQTADSGSLENHAQLRYSVDVYTNDVEGKKARCKKIMAAVCSHFDEVGFTRTVCQPVPNLLDPNIYRMTATFEAVMDTNKKLYRR